MPLVQRITELLDYNKDTGIFTWKVSRRGSAKAGDVAGSRCGHGYLAISIDGKLYAIHRLAYLVTHGEIEDGMEIDHINGIRDDNRVINLRKVSSEVNKQNLRAPHSRNKLGILGVRWRKDCQKYEASIQLNGKKKHLGLFQTAELASAAYLDAKRSFHSGCTI